jgi:ribosomal protein S18 acetylase RimI-like enzyme
MPMPWPVRRDGAGRSFTMVTHGAGPGLFRRKDRRRGDQGLGLRANTKYSMKPTLRVSNPEDQDFLFRLYASTRQAEFAALGWSGAQMEPLLRMQFSAQQRWYETVHAQAEEQIVMLGEEPVGRIIVHRAADDMTLVDISLLPEHRGQGTGTTLIRDLITECNQKRIKLHLQVLKSNPAARLYERLGFTKTGEDGMYVQMERQPG